MKRLHNLLKISVLLLLFTYSQCTAEELTVIYTDYATGQTGQISGSIEQYNRNGLLLKTSSGQIKSINIEYIVELKMDRPASYQEAVWKIQHSEYELAIPLLKKAFAEATNVWVRQEILAKQIDIHVKIGDFPSAFEKYNQLSRIPNTVYFDCVPLIWTSCDSTSLYKSATQFISQQQSPYLSLLGASVLLTTDKKSNALTTLKIHSQSDDTVLAILAQMQIHRISLTPLPATEIRKLESQVDSLPQSLQYGARFILAQLWSRCNTDGLDYADKIAINYLQCAKNSNAPLELQARSLYSAGKTLLEIGHKDEAFRIFNALIQKYPQSSWTEQAQRTVEGKL